MSKIIMLIGLPASGKSTIAKQLSETENAVIYSSDELRKELYGSYNVFDKNTELFDELHKRIIKDLKNGIDVVYDATNISMKRRKYFLSIIPKDINVKKVAIVVATPINNCLLRDLNRKKKVGSDVILNMWKSFQFPLWSEGWDDIRIEYANDVGDVNPHNWYDCAKVFEQDNPNHTFKLDDHMKRASEIYLENCDLWYSHDIYTALRLHDIGKLWTKTFYNKKGERSDVAHYYNHHNVSAYQFMFIYDLETYEKLYDGDYKYVIQLINYHMQPYFIETEKAIRKWKRIFDEKMWEDLLILNDCDRKAH